MDDVSKLLAETKDLLDSFKAPREYLENWKDIHRKLNITNWDLFQVKKSAIKRHRQGLMVSLNCLYEVEYWYLIKKEERSWLGYDDLDLTYIQKDYFEQVFKKVSIKKEKQKTKITFNTLLSLAKKEKLIWRIKYEFSWMEDWLVSSNSELKSFNEEDLKKVKMTKNYISRISETEVKLSNCCFIIIFNF